MTARRKSLMILTAATLTLLQVACSFAGFTLSQDQTEDPNNQPSATQPSGVEEQETSKQPETSDTNEKNFLILDTPTPEPDIQLDPPQSGKANAAGRILWNHQPVVGNEVMLCQEMKMFSGCEGEQYTAITGNNGEYIFKDVNPGEYALVMRAVNSDTWVYITAGLGINAKKYELVGGESLIVKDQNIFKMDLKLTYPADEAEISQDLPSLKWEVYPDALYYEIWLNPRYGESYRDEITENEYTPARALQNCEYTWTIEAFNKYGEEIAEYDGYSDFTVIDQPTSCEIVLESPQDGTNIKGTGVDFTWQAHPQADHYLFYVQDLDYKNVLEAIRVNGTTYTVTQDIAAGEYQWYVAAYDGDIWLGASDRFHFVIKAP